MRRRCGLLSNYFDHLSDIEINIDSRLGSEKNAVGPISRVSVITQSVITKFYCILVKLIKSSFLLFAIDCCYSDEQKSS